MTCFRPIKAWHKPGLSLSFREKPADGWREIEVRCEKCRGCRLERSRQWAMRCWHESMLYEDNCYLTLTYKQLPELGSLQLSDFQKFMKRLRKRFASRKLRVFYCGEYGDKDGRPHYHAIVFNLDFDDKEKFFKNEHGDWVYKSEVLSDIWKHGYATTAGVTFKSAAYVARYIMKKQLGGRSEDQHRRYRVVDPETGELLGERLPEFAKMSQSIGRDWFNLYLGDVYPKDFVTIDGVKMKPPKVYDQWLEEVPLPSQIKVANQPDLLLKIKAAREEHAWDRRADDTDERREVREECLRLKTERLERKL